MKTKAVHSGELINTMLRRRFIKTRLNEIWEIIQSQPEDATFEEIIPELAFERMVERGLADSRNDRLISNDKMGHRIRTWRK